MSESRLKIHVIGEGFGESIIVELPDGEGVGVVDCFCRQLSSRGAGLEHHPTLWFLQEFLKVGELRFVCLTHPHEDHTRGFSQILTHYRGHIRDIWMFPEFQAAELDKYLRVNASCGIPGPLEKMLGEKTGASSLDFIETRDEVLDQIFAKPPLSAFKSVRLGSEIIVMRATWPKLTIEFLGPSDLRAEKYCKALLRGPRKFNGTKKGNTYLGATVDHNEISGALLITYGRTHVLLGGDVINAAWQDAANVRMGCDFLKVSHHGSEGSHSPFLFPTAPHVQRPIAVLTPYNRNSNPLPTRKAIKFLKQYTSALFTTSTCFHFGRSWNSAVAVPPNWLGDIADRPELEELLLDSLRRGSRRRQRGSPRVAVPANWLRQLQKNPCLWRLLKPHHDSMRVANRYRISVSFDANCGHIVEHCGDGSRKL